MKGQRTGDKGVCNRGRLPRGVHPHEVNCGGLRHLGVIYKVRVYRGKERVSADVVPDVNLKYVSRLREYRLRGANATPKINLLSEARPRIKPTTTLRNRRGRAVFVDREFQSNRLHRQPDHDTPPGRQIASHRSLGHEGTVPRVEH